MFRERITFLKNNAFSVVKRWLRHRTYHVWARFPMVCVLAIALAAISLQEAMGNVWCSALFIAFVLFSAISLQQRRLKSESFSSWYSLTVVAGIALSVSFYHSLAQQDVQNRLVQWETSIQKIKDTQSIETVAWSPIACRGVIDQGFRYRKAVLPGSNAETGEVGWQTLTVVQIEEIREQGEWMPQRLLVPLAIDGKIAGYYPGDSIELYGQWRLPSTPSNPGQLDQSRRYAELGYAAQARADSEEQIKRTGRVKRFRFDRYLAMISAKALESIERYVILGQSELTAALVLGQREQAEWQLQEELLATGTIHMLSISGMHIEMVALALLVLGTLFQFPRKPLLLGVCLIVIAYALLCGGNPPVARATMMLSGLCIARWNGWSFSSLNFLAFAGVVLVFYRTSVVFETGTQLSFMAVAVLILSTNNSKRQVPALERLIDSKLSPTTRNFRSVVAWSREMLRTSFWVWFITAPLVWCSFHVISPIAIGLNLWLWLPMLLALLSGLAMVVVGWIPFLAWPLGILCGGSLWIVDVSVGLSEQIPWGHYWLRAPPNWWLFGFYGLGIVTAAMQGVKRRASRKRLLWILGAWFMFGLTIQPTRDWLQSWTKEADRKFCMTLIDVGHGTSIFIETPDQQTWLYDAGRLGDHQRSYQVMVDTLWALNIPRIHGLVLSHADSDHYNGISGIAKRFSIDKLLTTSQVYGHTSSLLQKNLQAAKSNGAKFNTWKKGDVYQGEGWNVLAMHPPEQGVDGTDNANSLCVMLEFAGRRILLPGDLEPPGMQMLVAQDNTKVDVLMAPHHGSLNSKSKELLRWCDPDTVVISGSHRAVSPRVLESFVAEKRRVFVTVRDHAIRIEISRDGKLETKHWVKDKWEPL